MLQSEVCLRSSLSPTHDAVNAAPFNHDVHTTAAFDRSSSWQFEASSYTATPRGHPSSLLQHDARASSWHNHLKPVQALVSQSGKLLARGKESAGLNTDSTAPRQFREEKGTVLEFGTKSTLDVTTKLGTVVDAEHLSKTFPQSSIDAVIACSVFEEIRKPCACRPGFFAWAASCSFKRVTPILCTPTLRLLAL